MVGRRRRGGTAARAVVLCNALKAFFFYKNVRDKNVVHDDNNYNYAVTAVVLGPEADVQDILSLQVQYMSDNFENGQIMYNLIDVALKYVASQVSAILKRAFKEAHALSPQDRAVLPAIQFAVPVPGDEAKSRKY